MKHNYRLYALLMGANFESIAYLLAAWQGAEWLNSNFPKDFDWSSATYLLALILVARSWYVLIRTLIRDQKSGNHEG